VAPFLFGHGVVAEYNGRGDVMCDWFAVLS